LGRPIGLAEARAEGRGALALRIAAKLGVESKGGPLIVGSGIDVIEIDRVEGALRRSGERFERRVFARSEIDDCRSRRRAGMHYAVRFAAKEAVMKALGTGWAGGVRWVDIETVSEPGRSLSHLSLRLHGRVAELAAARNARPHLAVSRTRSHAMAVVLFEDSDR
jgi:holo-[acyl-carrier protein] synthase